LECICRIAVWEGHDKDATCPVEQRIEKCVSKVLSLDGVKRSAAEAAVTRTKILNQRRSLAIRNSILLAHNQEDGASGHHQSHHRRSGGPGQHQGVFNRDQDDGVQNNESVSSSTKFRQAGQGVVHKIGRKERKQSRTQSGVKPALDLKKSRRRSFYFD